MIKDENKIIFESSGFKCQKCGYYDPLGKKLKLNKEHKTILCVICNAFAPDSVEEFEDYLSEKIDSNLLEPLRKYVKNTSQDIFKKGMMETAKKGNIVSRPPFGYKIENSLLIPNENADKVREIFEEFLQGNSLNLISKKHNLSVNGIKKILKNFTYIGKVKFDNKIMQGNHKSIISSELFNEVQKKFENLEKR